MKRLDDLLKDRVAIGKISNTHGLDGELKLFPFTNEKRIFNNLKDVLLYNSKTKRFLYAKINSIKKANKVYIIKIVGVETISAAQRYKNFVVYVPQEMLPELDGSEFYYFQLLEKNVYYDDGTYVGKIIDILETGANDVLIIEKKIDKFNKTESLYPLIKENIIKFNKNEEDIIVKRLEWYDDESEDRD
ncbi:16S rRNA processing protein RimM [Marinitoga hydrogenitolerans DSM 16785]|uniref:Ribosome maturation factor RimM n=1 Tax=Marinitoga hydrogenitolerans (strain DSM 16785 / JCM 12826 / AT1271) TaxID=1122195 RepID=A0A1M4V1K1_MARH1|nr:ribosome maturation factor RimM [Marinitoga hydrogenitolerans]SHE62767.1 16S rRNA processing protein RimM [Marinitoga hydrogenitolerans DSM 16785]